MPGSLLFVGNATVLLRWGPFTLLTDPHFLHRGQRVHLGYGLTAVRRKDPALRVEDLPPLDAVVLSHLHGDHWDRVARTRLDRGTPVLTTPHAARRLQGLHRFRRAVGLATWERHETVKEGHRLRVTALPGRHAPAPFGRLLPPVMGSLLELGPVDAEVRDRVYVTGDTLLFPGVDDIARRHPDVDLAVVHLGGTTLPGGLMVTMDARQGAELLERLRPAQAVPVHYDDYDLFRSSLDDFRDEVSRRGLADRVTYVDRGQTVPFGRGP